MRDDRRIRQLLEQDFEALKKRCEYHDEHLRIVDGWFLQVSVPLCKLCKYRVLTLIPQLLDEMSILSKGLPRDHLLGEYYIYLGQRSKAVSC